MKKIWWMSSAFGSSAPGPLGSNSLDSLFSLSSQIHTGSTASRQTSDRANKPGQASNDRPLKNPDNADLTIDYSRPRLKCAIRSTREFLALVMQEYTTDQRASLQESVLALIRSDDITFENVQRWLTEFAIRTAGLLKIVEYAQTKKDDDTPFTPNGPELIQAIQAGIKSINSNPEKLESDPPITLDVLPEEMKAEIINAMQG